VEAWSELLKFISSHAHIDLNMFGRDGGNDKEIVERFFKDPNDMYVIAEADASQLAEHLHRISLD
jgi:hypothetical protein